MREGETDRQTLTFRSNCHLEGMTLGHQIVKLIQPTLDGYNLTINGGRGNECHRISHIMLSGWHTKGVINTKSPCQFGSGYDGHLSVVYN